MAATKRRGHIGIMPPAKAVTPGSKGRMLGVEDIRQLLPRKPNGELVTRWYVNHSFFPEGKRKMGRANWWWETEVYEYLDRQRAEAV